MGAKVLKLIFTVFAIFWMVVVFSEYWRYNPNYGKALQLFQYYDLLILLLAIGAGITWYIKKPRKKALRPLNGLSIFGGLLLIDIIAVNRFCAKVDGFNFTIAGIFSQVGHIIGVALCLFLVYLLVRVIGKLFTSIFPPRIASVDLPMIQVALGTMIFTFLLFVFGMVGLLNPFVLVPICLLILAIYWRFSFQITKDTLIAPINIPKNINAVGVFSFLFLAVFLILNFVQILRPFPIGADSLRLYVNLPTLIMDYGGLVSGHKPYNWSLFMSTGLTIFGRTDVVLGLSFMGGLFSLFALWRLSRKWLNINLSALVLLLFYSIPMVSFLSYMDMKIDMGLLFITLSILLLFFNLTVPPKKLNDQPALNGVGLLKANTFFKQRIPQVLKQNRLLVLMGLLAGFAFGIKLTILLFFLALHSAIWYNRGGTIAFFSSLFLSLGFIFLLQLDGRADLRQFHQNVPVLQWGLIILGLGLMGYMFIKKKDKLAELVTYSLVIGSFFVLPFLPWLGKNIIETKKVTQFSLLNGKKSSPIIDLKKIDRGPSKKEIIIPGVYSMPEAPKKTENNRKQGKRKGVSEDLHRFMGYEAITFRYLSTPYDVFINSNITKFFTDVGFVLLILLPFLFLFPSGNNFGWQSILTKFAYMGLSLLILVISIPSAFLNKNNLTKTSDGLSLLESMESDGLLSQISAWSNRTFLELFAPLNDWVLSISSAKDAITYPLLMVLFLLFLGMIFQRIQNHSLSTKSTVLLMTQYFFLWWILGSGAPWYGMLIFCLPFIFFMKSVSRENDEEGNPTQKFNLLKRPRKGVFLSIAFLWVFLSFTQRSANYNPANKQLAQQLYFPSMLNYQMGNLNENKIMDYHFPNVRQLVKPINKDKKSLVYMVGSPYTFFIDKNDSRVFSDTYLEFFDQLIKNYKSKDQIIAKLKEEGFKYIIFDLNMFSYDVTPGKTLTRKFINFMNTLYGNPGVELMATDRKIKLYEGGQEVFAVFQDKGDITRSGTIAIFKIK